MRPVRVMKTETPFAVVRMITKGAMALTLNWGLERRVNPSFFVTIFVLALAYGASGTALQPGPRNWDAERKRMVDEQLAARDIRSPRVLDAMLRVPRHLFVPEPQRANAYIDSPLPIGHDQTISQPYIVAFMTQALDVEPGHRVLEIGTGSGYQAAVLSTLAKEVYTIEIVAPLAERARETLKGLGYRNIQVRTGNGYLGWPEHAPYDRIMVTAAPDEVPAALVQQLKIGGLMAIPVGAVIQELRIVRRTATGIETLSTLPVRFVPMTGKPKGPPVPESRSLPSGDVPAQLTKAIALRLSKPSAASSAVAAGERCAGMSMNVIDSVDLTSRGDGIGPSAGVLHTMIDRLERQVLNPSRHVD